MRLEFEPNATAFPLVENEIHEDAFASVSWDFDSLLKKGVAAAQSGDRDGARKLLSQATAINPVSEDAWMWLASISDYPEELLAFLNRVLEINPDNEKATGWRSATNSLLAKTFVQRALAARNDGSFDRANQCLDQALAHDRECESAWFWKASLANAEEQKLEYFAQVLSINPENAEASEAVEHIEHAKVVASLEAARDHAANGSIDEAKVILDELVNHDSAEVRESALLIMCDIADSDDQKLDFLNRVLEVNPENQQAAGDIQAILRSRSMAAFDEARSAAATGDRVKALKILDGFVKEVPDSVDAWLLKSHLSEGLDEKVESLEKALEIDPENTAARSGLAFLALTFGTNSEPKVDAKAEMVETEEDVFAPEIAEAATYPVTEVLTETNAATDDLFADTSVEEFQNSSGLDAAVEFAYRPTEDSVQIEETATPDEIVEFDQSLAFDEEKAPEMPESFEDIVMPEPSPSYDLSTRPEPSRSVEEIFGPVTEEANPTTETMDSFSPFAQEVLNQNPFAAEPTASPFDQIVEQTFAVAEPQVETVSETTRLQAQVPVPADNTCPFCSTSNDPQAFECSSCSATLTLADIEKLLSGRNADKETVQRAVTKMEAEWNTREFSEGEFIVLGIGHFNLGNSDHGFRYLQEASRLNPNNVILSGQVNTVAIRLEEMSRQHETYEAMPKGKKILVVDDSPTVRKLISGKLEKSGHVVVCAVDGVDALAKLEEGLPDLVLLDITMPRMDGYEVCKQIRANPAGKNLPVVMISGKDGFFDKVRGRMAGTSGYVTKPFGPETLMKALETYLLPDEVEAN